MKLGDTSADPELALSKSPSYIKRDEDVSPYHYIKYWLCGECCLDTKDHHLIKHISAGAALLTFDILFFSTFAVGWTLTGNSPSSDNTFRTLLLLFLLLRVD